MPILPILTNVDQPSAGFVKLLQAQGMDDRSDELTFSKEHHGPDDWDLWGAQVIS